MSRMNLAKLLCRSYCTSKPQSVHFPVVHHPLLPPGSLAGRSALVTGGGTGIGKAIALKLAQAGSTVFISSRKMDVIQSTALEIREASKNNNVHAIACNVRDPKMVAELVDTCEKEFHQLPSLIVNNAAGNFISPTERLSSNAFHTIISTVLEGTVNVVLETGKRLIAAKQRGTYLAITTIYAESGSPFVVPSASAKAGVEAMTKSLAAEWGRYGLRFNAIAPGPIYTKGAFSRLDPTGSYAELALEKLPCGRMGDPDEIANLAAYMLSDYASWMSGSIVRFDGGEYPSIAGEFSDLRSVSSNQWDQLEKIIRSVKGS